MFGIDVYTAPIMQNSQGFGFTPPAPEGHR